MCMQSDLYMHMYIAHVHNHSHIRTVLLRLSHRDCHIAYVSLHIAMATSISSHSGPFSSICTSLCSICTSLSSNLHYRIARPPGPPYLPLLLTFGLAANVLINDHHTHWDFPTRFATITSRISHCQRRFETVTSRSSHSHRRIAQRIVMVAPRIAHCDGHVSIVA